MFTKGQRIQPSDKYRQYFDHARIKVNRGTIVRPCRNTTTWYIVKWDEKRTPEPLDETFIEPLSHLGLATDKG
jgi:hypothetical protein